jgi:hypothetical protein
VAIGVSSCLDEADRTHAMLEGVIRNPIVSFGLICAFGVIGLLLQASQALGHDLGWLLFATERLLDGADVYGRDVFEWNPPANLYLLTPAVIASDWLDVSVATAAALHRRSDRAVPGLVQQDRPLPLRAGSTGGSSLRAGRCGLCALHRSRGVVRAA